MKCTESAAGKSGTSNGGVRGKSHRDGERAARQLKLTIQRLQLELGLRARRLRLQHVGDCREPDAMPLVRRVERLRREIDGGALRVALRARRQ